MRYFVDWTLAHDIDAVEYMQDRGIDVCFTEGGIVCFIEGRFPHPTEGEE